MSLFINYSMKLPAIYLKQTIKDGTKSGKTGGIPLDNVNQIEEMKLSPSAFFQGNSPVFSLISMSTEKRAFFIRWQFSVCFLENSVLKLKKCRYYNEKCAKNKGHKQRKR